VDPALKKHPLPAWYKKNGTRFNNKTTWNGTKNVVIWYQKLAQRWHQNGHKMASKIGPTMAKKLHTLTAAATAMAVTAVMAVTAITAAATAVAVTASFDM
jgi:predicted membrane-bound mannosyltransferase